MRGRPRSFDTEAAVERAMGVFWSRGYHATARPDLLRATKLSHGSLYAAFGDKHSLFLRALDRYVADALTRMAIELDPRREPVDDLRAYGSEGRFLHASIHEEIHRPGVPKMWSIDVHRKFGHRKIWNVHNDTRARTITIHDYRKASDIYTERPMADAEFVLCEFTEPEFDDFKELWGRVETFLEWKGIEAWRD